jgi:hypothetical protein
LTTSGLTCDSLRADNRLPIRRDSTGPHHHATKNIFQQFVAGKRRTMAFRKSVVALLSAVLFLLIVTDRRLHVVKFLAPAMLFIACLIAAAYFMEARNWSFRTTRRIRRVSDEAPQIVE